MGQKINPIGLRLGVNRTWDSRWFSNKRISTEVRKALESAFANAENNHELDVDDLVVAQAWVGKDMVMKRFSPRARGRAGKIQKPFSNITIVVREVSAETAKAA